MIQTIPEVTASVREVSHEVHVDLTDAPPLKTAGGRRRKPTGLRIRYGIGPYVHRVDIVVEYRDAAEHFPPAGEMPGWMSRVVEDSRPRDVDDPSERRRTGMGGWDVPAPVVPEGDAPGSHDPAALHATVVRGLRALGFGPEKAERYATAHLQDVLDRAGEAISDEAWPHERPEAENEMLHALAAKVRHLRLP